MDVVEFNCKLQCVNKGVLSYPKGLRDVHKHSQSKLRLCVLQSSWLWVKARMQFVHTTSQLANIVKSGKVPVDIVQR